MLLKKTIDIVASQTGTTVIDPGAAAGLEIARITFSPITAGLLTVFIGTDADPNRLLYMQATIGIPQVADWMDARADDRPRGAKTIILKYTTGTVITGRLLVEYALRQNTDY
jgi:hypothetical protein